MIGDPMKASPRDTAALLAVVLLSGFTFLVYEVSWFRMLALMVGATVAASTIVLVAFMAGLGAGARLFGGRLAAGGDPARLAALLLLSVGLCGLASFPLAQAGLPALYDRLAAAGFGVASAGRAALLASLAALFAPAFFMGGFLPAMAALLVRDDRTLAAMTGRLYALETLGSALGALAAGFVLIRALGQAGALHLAVAVNLLCAALLFFRFARSASPGDAATGPAAADGAAADGAAEPPPAPRAGRSAVAAFARKRAALLCAFAFGLCVAGLQVAWFRILRVYLTNTSYTFSLVTAAVILGLFAGGLRYARAPRPGAPAELARPLLLAALAAAVGFALLVFLPQLVMFPLAGAQESYLTRIFVIPVVTSLLVILPVAFASGYAFPMACAAHAESHREIGGSMGAIYAASTAGAVIGPLACAFALIPAKGAALSVLVFAALLASAGLALAWRPAPAAGAAALALALILVLPVVRVMPASFARGDRQILKYRETTEGTWLVARAAGGGEVAASTYVNNSAVIGSTYDAIKAVKMVGHLPFYAGLACRRALVVGFGIGVTTSAIASHPEVERIDCVELVAGLREAAAYYESFNGGIQRDPRLTIIPGDGRHYLQATGETYDLISCDPTHPVLGSGSLYTKEYFELCRRRLAPGGMVSQYLPVHKMRLDDLLGIIKTFHAVFPGATVWLGHSHAILLGGREPLRIDFPAWSARVAASVKDPYFYANPYHLAASLIFDGAAIAAFPERIRLNLDHRPLTEFFALESLDEANTPRNLAFLNDHRVAPERLFAAVPDAAALARFVEGNRLLTAGIVKDVAGDRAGFLAAVAEAAQANPENEEYPFLIKFFR